MQFSEILAGVYEVTTDLDLDLWQRSLVELQECQDTQPEAATASHDYTQPDLGAMQIHTKGAACAKVLAYFQSDHWLDAVSKLCLSDDEWRNNWTSPSVSWFRKHTLFSYVWHMVPDNYVNHEWHVDCLRTVVHGMMYLNDKHDATATTLFKAGDKEIAVTTGFNRGWILLQNGKQMHRGINISNQSSINRLSINRWSDRHASLRSGNRSRYTFKWILALNI